MEQGECESGIRAGERLEMEVGVRRRRMPDRIDDDDCPGASRSQCRWAWGAVADGFASQTRMQAASRAERGSKPSSDVPNVSCKGDMSGLVADRIRIDLGRADRWKKRSGKP